MDGFFKIKNIFIKVLIVIFALFLIDNLSLVFLGKKTEGKVIQYINNYAGNSINPIIKYPVIQFQVHGKTRKFNGNLDADYRPGDLVEVIYRPWRPRNAKVNTFMGITKSPTIQFIIISVVWIMLYSSFKPKK